MNVIFRNDSQMWYLENHNNWFNLTIPVVMKIAVATLGNFHAKPFGPELQVKQMLGPACGGTEQLYNMVWNRM